MAADGRSWRRTRAQDDDRVIDLTVFDRPDGHAAKPSWTVDLSRAEAEPWPAGSRGSAAAPSRRWILVASVATVAALLLAAAAILSYRRGSTWRDTAIEQRARGMALEERLESAGQAVIDAESAVERARAAREAALAARDAAAGRLGASEQDVVELEARIARLATEKARLEDEAAVAGQLRQTTAVGDAALARCVTDVRGWLAAAPHGAEVPAWEEWSAQAGAWETACDAALRAARR